MILLLIVGFILGVAALLFVLQNTAVVALTFLGWQFESSLALLVLASIAVGIVITLLVSLPSAIITSFRMMGLKKENKNLAQEVETHRQALAVAATADHIPPTVDLRQE